MGAAGAVEARSVLLAEATGRAAEGTARALLAERSEAGTLAALAGARSSRKACAGWVEELEPGR